MTTRTYMTTTTIGHVLEGLFGLSLIVLTLPIAFIMIISVTFRIFWPCHIGQPIMQAVAVFEIMVLARCTGTYAYWKARQFNYDNKD